VNRIAFFVEGRWVFAKIFDELRKYLYPEFDCDLIDWREYLKNPWAKRYLTDKYDLFVSTPFGCFFLHEQYGIDLRRCYAQLHAEYDVAYVLQNYSQARSYFNRVGGYSAVSTFLVDYSRQNGLERVPDLLPVGVTAHNYYRQPPKEIKKLGYFGKINRVDAEIVNTDIKRGYLAQQVAERAGLELVQHEDIPYTLIDQAYKHVDAVMFCSLTEGNPYPALEGCAAGLPVFGTPVGVFTDLAAEGGGILLPIEPEAFVTAAVEQVQQLNKTPDLLNEVSCRAAEIGRRRDWSFIAPRWKQSLASTLETLHTN